MNRRTLLCALAAALLCFTSLSLQPGSLSAEQREKPAEEPAGAAGRFRIHQTRLSNREDYTILLDTVTGRTWVLGLSRDGSKLSWFDLGLPPLDNKAQERR